MAPAQRSSATTTKRLTLDLPIEVHRALKVQAFDLDVPMAELIRELIRDALAKPATLRAIARRRSASK